MTENRSHILVVDDESDIRTLLRMVLERARFNVWEAQDGQEALEQVELIPDIILLNILLPGGLTGLDVCQRLKNSEKYKKILIIMLSGLVSKFDIARGLEAGANGYLTKPFEIRELIEVINKHLTK